jgi:TonB family protein
MRTLPAVLAVAFCGVLASQFGIAKERAYHVGGDVTSPRVLARIEPKYTEEARKAGVEGAIVLQLVVNAEGRPENVRVVKGLRSDLDENAVAALQQWKFEPGKKGGKPVSVFATIQVRFRVPLSPTDDPIYRVGGDVTAPRAIRRVEPEYTQAARAMRVSGIVALQAVINREGRAENIEIIRGLRTDLDKNAVAALQRWEFEPGKKDGKPVRVLTDIELKFSAM